MGDRTPKSIKSELALNPLLIRIGNMAKKLARIRISVVFTDARGWEQCLPGIDPNDKPEFCRMIQSVPEGAKQCRMCHVLMTVAACSTGSTTQRCHAGLTALIYPIKQESLDKSQAVMSGCTFTSRNKTKVWKTTELRGN